VGDGFTVAFGGR